jgi:hypothetical protein
VVEIADELSEQDTVLEKENGFIGSIRKGLVYKF